MNATATQTDEWTAGLAELSDRLVHARIVSQEERDRQRRLAGYLLLLPFPAVGCLLFTFASMFPVHVLLSAACGVFAVCWAGLIYLSLSARRGKAELFTVSVSTLLVAALVAGSGGLASPMLALAGLPLCEAWLIRRDKKAVHAGVVSALVIVLLQFALVEFAIPARPVSAGSWIVVLAYALLSGFRLHRAATRVDAGVKPGLGELASIAGAPVLVLNGMGEIVEAAGQSGADPRAKLREGTLLIDHVHVADRISLLTALDKVRQGAGQTSVALRMRAPDGFRDVAVDVVPNRQDKASIMAILRDRSDVQALHRDLAEANDRAAGTEIAKGRFLGAVSHELRTPLNAIIGFSDMMLHNLAGELPQGRQRDYIGLIRESGQHLLSVVNAILDVSKIEAGAYAIQPEPFELMDATELCSGMMSPLAHARGVSLETRVPPGIGELVADRRAVQQMLINLVSNAIKFTPAGGEVRLEAIRHGSRMEIRVVDNGIGISETDLQRLGQPFVQVCDDITRQYEGTGLGLSLVKGLVRLHEGELSIESAPGEGTTVRISLPVAGPRMQGPTLLPNITELNAAREKKSGESDETVRKIA